MTASIGYDVYESLKVNIDTFYDLRLMTISHTPKLPPSPYTPYFKIELLGNYDHMTNTYGDTKFYLTFGAFDISTERELHTILIEVITDGKYYSKLKAISEEIKSVYSTQDWINFPDFDFSLIHQLEDNFGTVITDKIVSYNG